MGKSLQNMDDIFKEAYEKFGEDPSPDVWEKINAGLDKKDAVSYRIISRNWKRVAIILILIVSGFILYESGIVKTSSRHQEQNAPVAADQQKINSDKNNNEAKGDVATEKDQLLEEHTTDRSKVSLKKNNPAAKISDGTIAEGNKTFQSILQQKKIKNKNISPGIKSQVVKRNNPNENAMVASSHTEVKQKLPASDENIIKEKIILALHKEVHAEELPGQLSSVHNDYFHIPGNAIGDKKQMRSNKFKPYWSATAFTSYDHANYRLENDFQTVQSIKHEENHQPSFSTGMLLTRQLSAKLGIQTGLVYSKTSIGINPKKIYASNDPGGTISYKYVSSSGYGYVKPNFGAAPAIGDSLEATEAKHSIHQVSIPFEIKYTVRKNKLAISPGIGIAGNFLTGENIKTEVEDGSHKEPVSIDRLSGTRSFNWSLLADADIQYKLADKMSLDFRPSFRYALSPITRYNVVETYPYSFGAGLGVTYKF